MSNVIRLALVDPSDTTRESLKAMLLAMDMVWLEAECSRYEFFADVIAQTKPDIGIVSLDGNPEKALSLVSQLTTERTDCAILVLSASTDGNLILRSMRAGAKEFLPQPIKLDDLVAALDRVMAHRRGRGEARSRASTVIAVAGATGGVGTTSVAVNLGCALARNESASVALVDLDLALGDADVFLDAIPDYTLADVAQNIDRLDFSLLKRSLTKHSSGLFLLPRPVQIDDATLITPDELKRVIGLLKATFTHLLFDLSKTYSPLDRLAIEMADHVLLVTQLDLPCLRNVVRLMASFAEMEGVTNKVKVVINRLGLENGQISLKKAQDTIGREIYFKLPNDYATMVEVRNNGVPLIEHAPKSRICHAFQQLAEQLSGAEPTAAAAHDLSRSGISKLLGGFWSKSETRPES